VVSRTCREVVVQEEQIASLAQASIEFVHANNPIPKVSGNRISRFGASVDDGPNVELSLSPSLFEGRFFQPICINYLCGPSEFVHIVIMPERDPNEKALEQVEKATESEPAKSKDLLESEDLERKVVDSKKRITDENTSRPTS
jgi:hypothetical protein